MKSSRFVFLLLVLCCFMIVVINLPHTTPQTGAIPALYPTSFPSAQHDFPKNPQIPVFQSDTSKYQYLGDILYNLPDTFTLPKNMAGYTVDSYSITAVQAEALAQSLGLQTTPEQATTQTENYLTWSSENGVHLQIALQSGSIEYSNSYVPGKSDAVKKIDTKEAVVAAATAFLKKSGLLFSDVSADTSSVTYFSENGGEPVSSDTFESASLFSVSFTRKLDGITLYSNYGNDSQIVVWVDRLGVINKASIQYAAVHRGIAQSLLGIEAAKNAVPKAGVTVHLGRDERAITQTAIKTTTFNQIHIGYFDDRAAKLYYPIYIFSGTAQREDGTGYDITVYLPALRQ
jgi:hypothetical protein